MMGASQWLLYMHWYDSAVSINEFCNRPKVLNIYISPLLLLLLSKCSSTYSACARTIINSMLLCSVQTVRKIIYHISVYCFAYCIWPLHGRYCKCDIDMFRIKGHHISLFRRFLMMCVTVLRSAAESLYPPFEAVLLKQSLYCLVCTAMAF